MCYANKKYTLVGSSLFMHERVKHVIKKIWQINTQKGSLFVEREKRIVYDTFPWRKYNTIIQLMRFRLGFVCNKRLYFQKLFAWYFWSLNSSKKMLVEEKLVNACNIAHHLYKSFCRRLQLRPWGQCGSTCQLPLKTGGANGDDLVWKWFFACI